MDNKTNSLVESLPILPMHTLVRENSSHNRSGINKDSGNFLYTDSNGEAVLFDAAGPGCIRSIFATLIHNNPSIKFYFDGMETAQICVPIQELFSGTHPLFLAPLASYRVLGYYLGEDSKGGNLLMPIPFKRGLKITLSGDSDIFYHILWEQYPLDNALSDEAVAESLHAAREIWQPLTFSPRDSRRNEESITLLPGKKTVFYTANAPLCISSLTIVGGCIDALLKDTFLCIRWDDDLYDSVHVPLGHFFGIPSGPVNLQTPLVRVKIVDNYTIRLECSWPMPFWKSATLSLLNLGQTTISGIRTVVETAPLTYSADSSGYFTCHYHAGRTEYGKDWSLLQASGWGKYVGTIQTMQGEHYCEGDEHFYLDGSCTPQINGTGTEDYYLFCFWPSPQCTTPYNGSTTDVYRQGGGHYENSYLFPSTYYRFHLDCPIPFYSSIDARIQHGAMSNIHSHYASLAFAYLRRTPRLVTSDHFEVANPHAQQMHQYQAVGGTSVTTEASCIGNAINVRQRLSGVEFDAGTIRFRLAIDPDNDGVILRRRTDQRQARQRAEVFIDQQPAGTWYDANLNSVHRWYDSDFLAPPELCRGKSHLDVTLQVETFESYKFTAYFIEALSLTRPAAALFDERTAILGEFADRAD